MHTYTPAPASTNRNCVSTGTAPPASPHDGVIHQSLFFAHATHRRPCRAPSDARKCDVGFPELGLAPRTTKGVPSRVDPDVLTYTLPAGTSVRTLICVSPSGRGEEGSGAVSVRWIDENFRFRGGCCLAECVRVTERAVRSPPRSIASVQSAIKSITREYPKKERQVSSVIRQRAFKRRGPPRTERRERVLLSFCSRSIFVLYSV